MNPFQRSKALIYASIRIYCREQRRALLPKGLLHATMHLNRSKRDVDNGPLRPRIQQALEPAFGPPILLSPNNGLSASDVRCFHVMGKCAVSLLSAQMSNGSK
jgi:hypothetical protein